MHAAPERLLTSSVITTSLRRKNTAPSRHLEEIEHRQILQTLGYGTHGGFPNEGIS